ncbi:putative nicotinamide N-methyase [Rhizobium mesoamericanum]|nr:putative nicotinamide N-methyase [Rhizobium mesoamericanum]
MRSAGLVVSTSRRSEPSLKTDPEIFIRANTSLMTPLHVPEIRLHLADEAHGLWLKTEEELAEIGLPPPYWAFAWAGGQGLARFILDHPHIVASKRVLDFATGSGLVAIAAKMAGAARVVAADIDPWSETAVRLNAGLNQVEVDFIGANLIDCNVEADVLLAGDVFYDSDFAAAIVPWFETLSRQGIAVMVGDPGRSYLPKEKLEFRAVYQVPVTRALEDSEVKKTTVWRFTA